MATYYGMVTTKEDAITIINACIVGCLPIFQRQLNNKEYQFIQPGTVFVWDRNESAIQTSTDGRRWNSYRKSGPFEWFFEKPYKAVGLIKTVFSTDMSGRCFRLVCYSKADPKIPKHQQPSQDNDLKQRIAARTSHLNNYTTYVTKEEPKVHQTLCMPQKYLPEIKPLQTGPSRCVQFPSSVATPQEQAASLCSGSSSIRKCEVGSERCSVPVSTWTTLLPADPSFGLSSQVPCITQGISSKPEVVRTDWSQNLGSANHLASPQNQVDDTEESVKHKDVDVVPSTDLLHDRLLEVENRLSEGINTLGNGEYGHLGQATLEEYVSWLRCLNIIHLCYCDEPSSPLGLGSRYTFARDTTSGVDLLKHAFDPIILKAMQYVRSVALNTQTDSRLTSKGPVMSKEQEEIRASFEGWYDAFLNSDRLLPGSWGMIRAEADMKYLVAIICIRACHFHDESVYDCFRVSFQRIVELVGLIVKGLSAVPSEPTNYKLDPMTHCLPFLEFVILKCRCLDIRYQAWQLVKKLATDESEPVVWGNLLLVGERIILKEHNIKIGEPNGFQVVEPNNTKIVETSCYYFGQFPLPTEAIRIKDYTTDRDFSGLGTVQRINTHTSTKAHYLARLLLRCGSGELSDLAKWLEGKSSSP
ncbi:cAMP-independent regulatory protein pac2 [Colletotrichum spaethianum]|uniref:cAMP-independent regulatory protein pac2 n=1 Tax=Colletotrichum spaethianum TaxID=700344 RepID=A0AA37PI18_9PEZI|nr:cAMP-independent regulatory protein pac2 [Colletotrichum spaethianum]GKT52624.1 cAMP-independent regulatory protein pac2 [Colletotrichum spaethianum]